VTEATAAESALRRQASLAAVGQAAAQVAHEIKNPLGSIMLGVSLLRDTANDDESRSTIKLIERGIQHLNKLTIDVTQYSRECALELSSVDLNELLDTSLELVRDRIAEKRICIERRYTDEPLRGDMDADQLRQVFVNLLANAIDASAEDAPIHITTEARRRDTTEQGQINDGRTRLALITIADEGSGIDERTRKRLFEPFFTTKKRGTGLGLAVSKKIIEQHGGKIELESEQGKGTLFAIQLPI
jgi:signal transduction histidine kinase